MSATARERARARVERGSGSVLVAAAAVLMVAVTWLSVCLVGWLASVQRAADIADLAALAGARAQTASRDACAAARETARANGALSASCSVDATAVDFVVEVTATVEARPGLRMGGAPESVSRSAKAGPVRPPG